jgi:protein TonB
MSTFLQKLDAHLPFNKTERIIIVIVVVLHLSPSIYLLLVSLFSGEPPTPPEPDQRVMADLVSPDNANKSQQPPAPPPPKPKPEQKQKTVDEKSAEKPAPVQPQQQTQSPQTTSQNKSESTLPNTSVAPATTGGASGTPIQTDIGKLIVVYQPDADAYYPSFSKRSGEQGEVVVKLIIDETGVVEEVTMLRSSAFPRLDRAATEIGKRYRFKPFLVNGSPARISTNLAIRFNLKS